jgi:hypothetical protein
MINTLQIRRYAFCAITCAVIAIGSFLATRSLHSQVFASATQLTPYTMKLTETITHVPTSRTVTGRVIFQAVATDGSKAGAMLAP